MVTDTYHSKAVAYPEVVPVWRAVRDIHVLAVYRYHIGLYLTHHTPIHQASLFVSLRQVLSYLEMNSGIACSATGIIGIGSFVESQ